MTITSTEPHPGELFFKVEEPHLDKAASEFYLQQNLAPTRKSLDGVSDHGVGEFVYLRDSDDNGLELTRARQSRFWPLTRSGDIAMFVRGLDMNALLEEFEIMMM
jgi:catechol-2,3-dioxygenase